MESEPLCFQLQASQNALIGKGRAPRRLFYLFCLGQAGEFVS